MKVGGDGARSEEDRERGSAPTAPIFESQGFISRKGVNYVTPLLTPPTDGLAVVELSLAYEHT